jgi:CelD/BcsL family acetyltransferase involved in cellulose biosynthesis
VTATTDAMSTAMQTQTLAVGDPLWLKFVAETDDALAFHLPAWSRVLELSYGYRPFVLAALRRGEVVAGLPIVEVERLRKKWWIALPFSDVCPPLGAEAGVGAVLSAIESKVETGEVAGIEIRSAMSRTLARQSPRGVLHTLSLSSDPHELLKTFSKSQVQRNIKRASREGVVVRRGTRAEDLLDSFFDLQLETRRRHGLPVQPRSFFIHVWEQMIEPGNGFVLLSDVEGETVAAAVFLLGNGTISYKYGASASSSWSKRPNHALFWQAIQWACEQSYHTFDFGRSDLDGSGLRAFKSGWGTVESDLAYTTIGRSPLRVPEALSTAVRPVLRRAPRRLSLILGRALYRYVG